MKPETISTSFVRNMIKPRPADMHKGQAGRVLIIAGSKGMAGAAVLAARGALYSGAGLVKTAVPEELFNILQISVPEAMCLDRQELAKAIQPTLSQQDVICMGPGLGEKEENMPIIKKVLEGFEGPVVLDADAINCLVKFGEGDADHSLDLIRKREEPTVITPHPGEADRLLRALGKPGYKELNREKTAEILASELKCIVLLKGQNTLITDGSAAGAQLFLNPTGNPGMATGGSGDVLSGMISALLAQKHLEADTVSRVNAAAFLHGIAGDIAAENVGEYGMTSADIADAVSVAFKEITE